MRILLIDNGTDLLESLIDFFKRSHFAFDIVAHGSIPLDRAHEYDSIVLSGGIWYDDPDEQDRYYREEVGLVRSSEVPILGICLGMLLISEAFGGELIELGKRYDGGRYISLTDARPGLTGLPQKFEVRESHTMAVSRVPDDFEVLARSNICVEIIKHKKRPIIGVQFHPESRSGTQADIVWASLFGSLGLEY